MPHPRMAFGLSESWPPSLCLPIWLQPPTVTTREGILVLTQSGEKLIQTVRKLYETKARA